MKINHKNKSMLNACFLALSIVFCSVATSSISLLVPANAYAQPNSAIGERETRRTPALRSRVYEQLARAQTLSDTGDVQGAIAILDEVKNKSSSMNSYERAMMYNFYGFIYYAQEDFDNTIASFTQAISQSPIPIGFEQTALYSLAQLSMAKGDFDQVITYLERWEALNKGVIPPKNYILKAQALYQNKAYKKAVRYIEEAIVNHENAGYLPDENWLVLQRAIYYEMQQPEKVKNIIVKLIRLYDQPKYWIQLAGMYGQLEQGDKQFATMEIAYQRGFVNSAADIYNLAQLYYYHGTPYKGAQLIERGIESGVLKDNLRNLKFLAQSWQLAKEDEKAVPVLEAAAKLSIDGQLDAQLALLYYNLDEFDKSIHAATIALDKGNLDRPGDTIMVLGLAHYNNQNFTRALEYMSKAEEFNSSRVVARQWRGYVEKEKSAYALRKGMTAAP